MFTKPESDGGRSEYAIEFYFGNAAYEYSINAKTSSILEFGKEYDD